MGGIGEMTADRPCKRGHLAGRDGKRYCLECKRIAAAARNQKAETRVIAAAYRADNASRLKQYFKEHYAKNRAAIRAKQAVYSKVNSATIVQRVGAWNKANPEAKRVSVRNRRAAIRQVGGRHTRKDVLELLDQQQCRCNACRIDVRIIGYHVDHVVPVARGGSNGRENLQILCPQCNQLKGVMTMDEFKQRRGSAAQWAQLGK